LCKLIQDAITKKKNLKDQKLRREELLSAIHAARRSFAAGLTTDLEYEYLNYLYEKGYRKRETEESGSIYDRLLLGNYIVIYYNSNFWEDVHPNVIPLIEEWRKRPGVI
jgi:hypothetical protein